MRPRGLERNSTWSSLQYDCQVTYCRLVNIMMVVLFVSSRNEVLVDKRGGIEICLCGDVYSLEHDDLSRGGHRLVGKQESQRHAAHSELQVHMGLKLSDGSRL